MKKLELDQIKDIELNMLVEFDKLCKSNNIYYSLCGGTMLGAIRHKGFIPWDDDIDVMVPRSDYDRLLSMNDIDVSELPDYIKVVSWKEKTVPYPFIKIINLHTCVDSIYTKGSDNHLWIDVLPVDGLPENENELKKIYKRAKIMRLLIGIKNARLGEGKTIIKKIIKPVLKLLLLPIDVYSLCEKLDCISRKYPINNSKYVGIIAWGLYGTGERIDRISFLKSVEVSFEQHTFNAMSNYHEYLTGLYNDYMKLPPEKDRKTHDMIVYVIDCQRKQGDYNENNSCDFNI